jgi:hypothetical protein
LPRFFAVNEAFKLEATRIGDPGWIGNDGGGRCWSVVVRLDDAAFERLGVELIDGDLALRDDRN